MTVVSLGMSDEPRIYLSRIVYISKFYNFVCMHLQLPLCMEVCVYVSES